MKRFGDRLVLQFDPMQIIGLVVAIATIVSLIIGGYWSYKNLVCRLNIEFDDANCTHQLGDSLGIHFVPGPPPKINSTHFRVKFTVNNRSKKGTTIHRIRHEVKISGRWHQTETPDLKHTVTLEGDDSERFDEYPMDRAYLLDDNQLQCQIILLHTHGIKKQEYTSHKTR